MCASCCNTAPPLRRTPALKTFPISADTGASAVLSATAAPQGSAAPRAARLRRPGGGSATPRAGRLRCPGSTASYSQLKALGPAKVHARGNGQSIWLGPPQAHLTEVRCRAAISGHAEQLLVQVVALLLMHVGRLELAVGGVGSIKTLLPPPLCCTCSAPPWCCQWAVECTPAWGRGCRRQRRQTGGAAHHCAPGRPLRSWPQRH